MNIKLTPALFGELDKIARTRAGCVIEVVDYQDKEMKDTFAAVPPLSTGVVCDIENPGRYGECRSIVLVNQIHVERFRSTKRPEITWQRIPNDHIYHYLLWHEIGHIRLDPDFHSVMLKGGADLLNWTSLANEMRADRYAWNAIYPQKALPKRPGSTTIVRNLDKIITENTELFNRRSPKRKALPTQKGLFIPLSHYRKGIPWV